MTGRPRLAGALRHADFRNYLFAGALATVAAEMQSVAIGWQVYPLTGSFAQLGFIGLAQFTPFTRPVLLAGQVAGRHDRGRIATACVLLQSAGRALPVAFAHSGSHGARAFAMPAASAMVINVVAPQAIHSAAGCATRPRGRGQCHVRRRLRRARRIRVGDDGERVRTGALGGARRLCDEGGARAWAWLFPALRRADSFPSQPHEPQPGS